MPMVRQMPWTATTIGLLRPRRAQPQVQRINGPLWQREATSGEGWRPLQQIDPGGEMVAMRKKHATAQVVVALQIGVRLAQRVIHRQVEGVALGRAIQPDQQHVLAPFSGHLAFVAHGLLLSISALHLHMA